MEKMAWEIRDSTESKNGSPRPAGTLDATHSTIPPMESRSRIALVITSFHITEAGISDSGNPFLSSSVNVARASVLDIPPTSMRLARTSQTHIFLATTPAATIGKVSLPEK